MSYPSDPLHLLRLAWDAIGREAWSEVAALCDPLSLKAFKDRTLRALTPHRISSVEDYLSHSPDMPRAVAEYYVKTAQERADPDSRLREVFPTLQSRDELEQLTPAEVFTAWLVGRSLEIQLDKQVEQGIVSPELAERVRPTLKQSPSRPTVLGVLHDGDDLAHVVYRFKQGPSNDSQEEESQLRRLERDIIVSRSISIETCRRSPDGRWHLIADDHLLGLAHAVFFVEPPAE